MMKKLSQFLCMLLALALAFSMAACGASGGGTAGGGEKDYAAMSLDELKAELSTVNAGKLTVATSPDFAPYEFYAIGDDGEPYLAGFDMALAQYIADGLGLELEVVPMDFDGTIAELTNKNVDLGMAGYSPKPDRAEVMDFSDVYITGGQSFVCLQANKDQFAALEDTNKAGLSIGAQVGSIQVDLAKANSAEADIVELSKVTDIIAELLSGKLDGAYIETMVAESYAKNYPELCVALEVPYDSEGSVVGVNKGNAALVAAVNLLIAQCKADGTFNQYVIDANELASGEIIEGLLDG